MLKFSVQNVRIGIWVPDLYSGVLAQHGSTNPIPALEKHITANNPPDNYPLFSYRAANGHVCLTARKFLARCNTICLPSAGIWTANAYPTSTGHSFCNQRYN